MPRKVGSISARITELAYPYYRVDFTRHNNVWDSDDEDNESQWSYPIRFSYTRGSEGMVFLNTDEIPYNTAERYTGRVFWENNSTSIVRMIQDTFVVRKARGYPDASWSLISIYVSAERAWEKHHTL